MIRNGLKNTIIFIAQEKGSFKKYIGLCSNFFNMKKNLTIPEVSGFEVQQRSLSNLKNKVLKKGIDKFDFKVIFKGNRVTCLKMRKLMIKEGYICANSKCKD